MYTFNYFCFGHQLAKDPALNNLLNEYDMEFRKTINGKEFQVYFPYHGGQVRGDIYSCVFGTIITDDDQNILYVDTIRNSKESDYLSDYNKFIESLLIELNHQLSEYPTSDPEIDKEIEEYESVVVKLKEFLKNNKPDFYCVEASS